LHNRNKHWGAMRFRDKLYNDASSKNNRFLDANQAIS